MRGFRTGNANPFKESERQGITNHGGIIVFSIEMNCFSGAYHLVRFLGIIPRMAASIAQLNGFSSPAYHQMGIHESIAPYILFELPQLLLLDDYVSNR
jgi:hypothetical protein